MLPRRRDSVPLPGLRMRSVRCPDGLGREIVIVLIGGGVKLVRYSHFLISALGSYHFGVVGRAFTHLAKCYLQC